MAIHYQVDDRRRVVLIQSAGRIELHEMFTFASRLRAEPAFHPDFNALIDLSELTGLEASFEELRRYARDANGDPFSVKALCVAVAPHDFAYGIARMYQTLREKLGNFRVVRTMDEARKLLGLDRAAAAK